MKEGTFAQKNKFYQSANTFKRHLEVFQNNQTPNNNNIIINNNIL